MSSIPRLDAASISMMSIWEFSMAMVQCAQVPQGCEVAPFSQSKAFANIRAVDVFPDPLRPEKR